MSQFTERQIQDYVAFDKVRSGGRYNMFDPRARTAAGLSREEMVFVMKNFAALKEVYEATGGNEAAS